MIEYSYYIAALVTACCWATSSVIVRYPIKKIGSLPFTNYRLLYAAFILLFLSYFSGWSTINLHNFSIIALSGLVGIFLGDSALFITLQRLGPRRAHIIFSLNAPFTSILSYFILQEVWTTITLWGCLLVFVGVSLSVFFGTSKRSFNSWEEIIGNPRIGIAVGLLAALLQAGGLIIIKPAMTENISFYTASTIRIGIASVSFFTMSCFFRLIKKEHFTWDTQIPIIISAILSMVLGVTFILYALSGGNTGVVATLSATAPIIQLPLLWIITKKRPALWAWIGSIIAIVGAYYLFAY